MIKILLVEDNELIIKGLKYSLEQEKFQVEVSKTYNKSKELLEKETYDLIIVDIMLPDGSGFDLCKYIKEKLEVPVIFLTAKDEEKDVVYGFDIGADDYVIKPFRNRELISRINNVLRRYNKVNDVQKVDDVEINIIARTVKKNDKEINLTPKEFDLLVLLLQNKNFALYRETIFEKIWSENLEFETRTLDLHIQRLRKKLGWKDKIKTVYKIGYMLEV